jgi:N-acetylmuramoyl-L-alanine amidase
MSTVPSLSTTIRRILHDPVGPPQMRMTRATFSSMARPMPLILLVAICSASEGRDLILLAEEAITAELARFAPPVLTRDSWQAKPALPGMKEQTPLAVILHHTGVPRNPKVALEAKLRGLQAFSQRPGQVSPKRSKPAWPDIPYHYYIDYSGRIGEGRDVHYAGDTNTRYDTTNYIQIVVEGDFEIEAPAPEQMSATRDLLVWLMLSWNMSRERISVHKDHAPTTCPGRNFMTTLPELLAAVTEQRGDLISKICAQSPASGFASRYCAAK